MEVIKTHGLWNPGYGTDPLIYCCRDGRAALASYAYYRQAFASDPVAIPESPSEREAVIREELEELIVCGRPQCGYWSDNVCSWMDQSASKTKLVLHFEQAIANPLQALKKLEAFMRRPLIHPTPPSFQKLHEVNRKYFRCGHPIASEFNDTLLQALFFAFEWRGMKRAGYIEDYCWFVVDENNHPSPKIPDQLGARDIAVIRYIQFCIDSYGKKVHARNLRSFEAKITDIAQRISASFSRCNTSTLLFDEEIAYWR